MVKLTLVMPVYNVEKYLRACLDSLEAQTFTDWELICVDDGSPDNSGSILDEYAARDKRIKPIHQANAKVHAARNNALDHATGEWVGFLDPDDVIANNWLSVAMREATEGVDFVRMRYVKGVEPSADFNEETSGSNCVTTIEASEVPRWGWENLPRCGFLWLCFIRRERIGALRFRPDINCKEDGVFLLEMLPRLVGKTKQVECKGYFYRTVGGSLSVRKHFAIQTTSFLDAYREVWEAQKTWAQEHNITKLVRESLCRGATADICDWTQGLRKDDPMPKKEVLRAYLALKKSGALCEYWVYDRSRYRFVFWLWHQTGWILPMIIVGKSFLAVGNILRGLGLKKVSR